MNNHERIKKLVFTAILAALVIVFQTVFSHIKFLPVTLSFVLVPIAIGSLFLGPKYGLILGSVFGIVTFFDGLLGKDAFTQYFIQISPVRITLICLIKGACAGFFPGFIYKRMKESTFSSFFCSGLAPIINTGLFILLFLVMMSSPLKSWILEKDPQNVGATTISYLVIICAGFNFIIEFMINIILAPLLLRVIKAIKL